MSIPRLISFAACCALLSSCGLVNLEQMLCRTFPSELNQIVAAGEAVWIEFSIPVKKQNAEMLFRISTSTGNLSGDLSWVDNRLFFVPHADWEPGVRYALELCGEIECADGRRFNVSNIVPFFAVTDGLPPLLTQSEPVSGGNAGSLSTLSFTFNKAMNVLISPAEFFTITPSIDFEHEWRNGGTELSIRPRDRWIPFELYSWKVNQNLKDETGIALYREYSGNFIIQNQDFDAPVIASLEPAVNSWEFFFPPADGGPIGGGTAVEEDWIGYRDAIRINFLCPDPAIPLPTDSLARIDFSSLKAAFLIEPVVKGNLICLQRADGNDDFVFVLAEGERFLNNTLYHLRISRDLKNRAGVPLRDDFEAWFTADVADVAVERILIQNAESPEKVYLDLSPSDFNSFNPRDISVLPAENPDYYSIRFSADFFLEEDDRYAAADKISLVKIFPVSGIDYEKRNVIYQGGVLTIAFQLVSCEPGSVFQLLIRGGPEGLLDSREAYLEHDIFVYFRIDEALP